MRCEQIALSGDPQRLAAALRDLIPTGASVAETVTEIIVQVRTQGDRAVIDYTRRFDTAGAEPRALQVVDVELEVARRRLAPAIAQGLEAAIGNVRAVAEAGLRDERAVVFDDHEVTLREVAVERAAVYVPGGRAPYPSTVVMGVVVARVAGVPDVAVCAPPGPDSEVNEVVLAACQMAGASRVYRMGGAQAIAALAYGTETVAAVDVIVGPGSLYVQEAKRQVYGQVGIDGFAGPSDLVVIADAGTDPRPLALDLLAQAEHGSGTLVIAISTSSELLDALAAPIAAAPERGAAARLVEVADLEQALQLAQAFAPEHLELIGEQAEGLALRATHAGCVFVGAGAATAFGDYIAGSNHVLPTGGAARFASALSPRHFRRGFSLVRITALGAERLARMAGPVARAEGFEVHAQSMEARIRENGGDVAHG
ncbi:MAG: histidinol dehydrogenase [Solirubrobacterales bacterium]|nr:histidinol dehydrogenase [Solirubrobacterales bacterium]MBV9717108.1 histidinol dehydrogenase [Solirubrobacterales bacterium]